MAVCHGDDLTHHLSCHDNCCCDTRQHGDCFSCPYLHCCCVGKIVAINRYTVAIETFVTQRNQKPGPSTSCDGLKGHKVLYVEFSLSDAVILGDILKRNKNIIPELKGKKGRVSEKPGSLKTVRFKDKASETGSADNVKKLDSKNLKPSDKENIERDGVLSEVVNINENKDKIFQEKRSGEISKTGKVGVKSKPTLHRHVNAQGGSYFCRKENCSEQTENEKCVPVLSVKPVVQKRKSPESHDKTNSKILCVSKSRTSKQSGMDCFGHQRSDADDSRNVANVSKDRKLVKETIPKSDQFVEGYTKLKSEFNMEWNENSCLVKVNSRESVVIDACTKDSMSVMFNVQGQIWKNGKFESEVSSDCCDRVLEFI